MKRLLGHPLVRKFAESRSWRWATRTRRRTIVTGAVLGWLAFGYVLPASWFVQLAMLLWGTLGVHPDLQGGVGEFHELRVESGLLFYDARVSPRRGGGHELMFDVCRLTGTVHGVAVASVIDPRQRLRKIQWMKEGAKPRKPPTPPKRAPCNCPPGDPLCQCF